jgi:dTDP-4-dehydrorhamnose reductase
MNVLLTGMNGTVAPVVAHALVERGHRMHAWDRLRTPIDDAPARVALLDAVMPDWLFHIATGPIAWAESIAVACAERGIGLLYTSSVSIYAANRTAPIPCDAPADADDDYGRYKADCEARIRAACPRALIFRLGWQIGDAPGSNNMIDYLHKTANEQGHIPASRMWFPSCAFLADTAAALGDHFAILPPGDYQLEGNPGLSFFEIATRLNRLHGDPWTILPTDEPAQYNLMTDPRIPVRPISNRLPPS